jgi:hypothetical protein
MGSLRAMEHKDQYGNPISVYPPSPDTFLGCLIDRNGLKLTLLASKQPIPTGQTPPAHVSSARWILSALLKQPSTAHTPVRARSRTPALVRPPPSSLRVGVTILINYQQMMRLRRWAITVAGQVTMEVGKIESIFL